MTQLGAGGFGQVLLVQYSNKEFYALKCINKAFVLEQVRAAAQVGWLCTVQVWGQFFFSF